MSQQLIDAFSHQFTKDEVPELQSGYQVEVSQRIKEGNKERVQVFKGMVIAVNPGHGINSTFTVRKVSDGIGVEKVFPIHAPSLVEVKVVRAHKIKPAKANFVRGLSGKGLRFKEVLLKRTNKLFPKKAAPVAEVIEAKEEASE